MQVLLYRPWNDGKMPSENYSRLIVIYNTKLSLVSAYRLILLL